MPNRWVRQQGMVWTVLYVCCTDTWSHNNACSYIVWLDFSNMSPTENNELSSFNTCLTFSICCWHSPDKSKDLLIVCCCWGVGVSLHKFSASVLFTWATPWFFSLEIVKLMNVFFFKKIWGFELFTT